MTTNFIREMKNNNIKIAVYLSHFTVGSGKYLD